MMIAYATLLCAVLALLAVLALWLRLSTGRGTAGQALAVLQRQDGVLTALTSQLAQTRRELHDDQAQMRTELSSVLTTFRGEIADTLKELRADTQLQATLYETRLDQLTRAVAGHLDAIRAQLEQRLELIRTDSAAAACAARDETLRLLDQHRSTMLDTLGEFRTSLMTSLQHARDEQSQRLTDVTGRLDQLTSATEHRLEALRGSVESKLQEIRDDNGAKLEQMRATVDEKLQSTLEQRLGESFRTVSQHLESVQRGLGEMQTLASGVGDLKKVLTNVKVRGNWGEMQLGTILEQFLCPDQFECNFAPHEHGAERVEFAVKLPGRGSDPDDAVWVPIDSKFPQDDYIRMLEAYENADADAVHAAAKSLEQSIRRFAKEVHEKYINPPRTTNFAIMYLPVDGLYAEVARRSCLLEDLQTKYRLLIAGPTTIGGILTAFQAGFQTLAIQQRSEEVWSTLGKVKTEFGKFGGVLEKVQKKLHEAGKTIDAAHVRTRAIERSLRDVEAVALPPGVEVAVLEDGEPVLAGVLPAATDRFGD